MTYETLETERLVLRPVAIDGLDEAAGALFPMFSDPETMRFMPTPPHHHLSITRSYLHYYISRSGAFYWIVYLRDRPEAIGSVQFLGETQLPGMGYIIRREYWGRGITTEACRAVLDFGFNHIGYDRVECWIDDQNIASQRVATKLGLRLKGRLPQKYPHEANHHIMLVYGLWAREWRGEKVTMDEPRFFTVQPVLPVHDMAATVAYYQEKLGFNLDFLYGHPPYHAAVSRGDWSSQMVTFQLTRVPLEQAIQPAGHQYIFVDVKLDDLYAAYSMKEVDIISTPQSYPWGMREFAIRDLNGHILRFGTNM